MPARRWRAPLQAGFATMMLGLGTGVAAWADQPASIDVVLKDHRFQPAEIHVQTGKPAELKIHNEDESADEFDSSALRVEKIVPAHGSVTVRLRPLGPGKYPFMGEFHADTAQGVVISQ